MAFVKNVLPSVQLSNCNLLATEKSGRYISPFQLAMSSAPVLSRANSGPIYEAGPVELHWSNNNTNPGRHHRAEPTSYWATSHEVTMAPRSKLCSWTLRYNIQVDCFMTHWNQHSITAFHNCALQQQTFYYHIDYNTSTRIPFWMNK